MNNIRKTIPNDFVKLRQVHSDAVPLYLEAAEAKPAFDRVVQVDIQGQYSTLCDGEVCTACKRTMTCSHLSFILHLMNLVGHYHLFVLCFWFDLHIALTKELDIRICPTLKSITRVIEKARIKGGNSAAFVKDIVRAMVTVDSMDKVAVVLQVLCILHEKGQIEVVCIKERFLQALSVGGWRGRLQSSVYLIMYTHSWTCPSLCMPHRALCSTCKHRRDHQLPGVWCE